MNTPANQFGLSLYAAFFMEGMQDTHYHDVLKAYEPHGGALELVAEVVAYTTTLAALVQDKEAELIAKHGVADYPGVLEYEVCNAFGEYMANNVLATGNTPTHRDAVLWLKANVDAFFNRSQQSLAA